MNAQKKKLILQDKQAFEVPRAEVIIFSSDDIVTLSKPVYEGGNMGEWDPQSLDY